MADSEKRNEKKKRKRKQKSVEETTTVQTSKKHRVRFSEQQSESEIVEVDEEECEISEQIATNPKFEEGLPWKNLELILSIENKDLGLLKKVELAFDLVISKEKENDNYSEDCETVKTSRVVIFLNQWVQSLLTSSAKKTKIGGEKSDIQVSGTFLDFRCWKIFKFCLESSSKLQVSLSLHKDILLSIRSVVENIFTELNDMASNDVASHFDGMGFELHRTMLDCIGLVFSSHGGLSNENLDLWLSTVVAVLELVHKIHGESLNDGSIGLYVLRLSCSIFDPFAKFLRANPTYKKNGFHNFIYKLLEPLLHLLGILDHQVDGEFLDWKRKLLNLTEDVLSYGLFHPVQIDGFFGLNSVEKYLSGHDENIENSKTTIKSYHRHLFSKLKEIVASKKELATFNIGKLFSLLVARVKKLKGALVVSGYPKMIEKSHGEEHSGGNLLDHSSRTVPESVNVASEESNSSSQLTADKRKSLLDVLILFMEPLLHETNSYLHHERGMGLELSDVHRTLKSINSLLSSFMHEKIYLRTEDTSGGACINFLKKVYDMIMSLSSALITLSRCDINDRKEMEMLALSAKEVLVGVGYLLEIEYEVIGSDLTSLWVMMLSYLSLELSFTSVADRSSLLYKISDLGGQLFNLYSQLRQVNNAIFTLCKGIRLLVSHDGDHDAEANYTRFFTPFHEEAHVKSVGILLCSEEFKLAIQKAIISIPEGQASACLKQLIADISETLKWMKASDLADNEKKFGKSNLGNRFDWQAKLLGGALSEVYALVLNSLTVTTGNSTVVGMQVKDLITLLSPCMNSLVGLQPDVNKFLFSVTDNFSYSEQHGSKNDLKYSRSSHWVFVYFFQLYMSCRVLYRQAASLMPPDMSRKISAAMGDSFTAFCGRDWMQKTDWSNDGYFSCFLQSSASLLDAIQAVSTIYVQDSAADCSPLIYVIHAMALQRLVDLNRKIKSLEYLLQNNDCLVQIGLLDDDDLSSYHRKNKKLNKHISVLRQEAASLTDFMMESLSLVSKNQQPISASDNGGTKEPSSCENDEWDCSISSVNNKSLPTAVWWILCQNIDVWSIHAAKKKLKMFLSLLIRTSIPFGKRGSWLVEKHQCDKTNQLNRVTVWKISLELFSNSILYEQRFVRRHLASRFCRALEESASPFIKSSSGNFDFESLPNWPKVFDDLEDSPTIVTRNKNDIENDKEPKASLVTNMELTASQSLLNLLSWIPKGFLDAKSFSLLLSSIFNLERFVIGSLLNCQGTLNSQSLYELFTLFMSCRKVLKFIIIASCEEKTEASQTTVNYMYSGKSFPVIWLFKSLFVVVGNQKSLPKDVEVDHMIFSLMDHTLYVFLTLNKCHFNHVVHSISDAQKPSTEQENAGVDDEERDLIESDQRLGSSSSLKGWKIASRVAKSLREQMQSSLTLLKDAICDENISVGVDIENLNMFSSIIACFSGFLWGLVSILKQSDARSVEYKVILSGWKGKPVSEINRCVKVFEGLTNLLLGSLLLNDTRYFQLESKDIDWMGMEELLDKNNGGKKDISHGKKRYCSGALITVSAASESNDDSGIASDCQEEYKPIGSKSAASFLTGIDSLEDLPLNKPFLRNLLKGHCPQAAFLLRELFLASSAVLSLNLHINCAPLSARLMQTFTGISQVLLSELVGMVDVPQSLSFFWLDGVVKYLEELGNHFPMTDPTLSRNLYVKIAELQLRAIGKCITLQGKRATLASHEIESSTKLLRSHSGLSKVSLSCEPHGLKEFKSRLRLSFTAFIKKSSELHLLSAIQAIERALVGIREKSTMIYDIQTGSANGGKVSSTVAAGIDCLDLVLESISGRKRLNVVKRHIHNFIASAFSIILHLHGPVIFYKRLVDDTDPDPGAVVLMCIEVLIRISGKHALFQMEGWHVAQSLRIPGAIFQNFCRLKLSKTSIQSGSSTISSDLISDPVRSKQFCGIDRQFSIDLFAASCRILYNVLKHHKSELNRCIALLEASVSVLLHCLETVDSDSTDRHNCFSWEVEEGVKCAYCLRRIYEEIRHQKDVLGRHCSQFLSNYIWVYSGYGPLKTGIKREIDEALRPGVYALIDACSAAELQHLHTVFGEGPCRSTLASLQRDYKLNFQYEGKV